MNLPWQVFKFMEAESYARILRLPVSTGMGFAKLHLQTEEGGGRAEPLLDLADPPVRVQTCTFHTSRTLGVSVLDMPKPDHQEAVVIKTSPRRRTPRPPVEASRQTRAPPTTQDPPTQADIADAFSHPPAPTTTTSYLTGVYGEAGFAGDSWLTNPALISDSKDGAATLVNSPAAFSCPGMYLQRSSSATIDIVFRGGPKVWLVVKPASSRKLEDCVRAILSRPSRGKRPDEHQQPGRGNPIMPCSQFFLHDKIFVTRAVLDQWGVTYCVFRCVEGDVAVVPPGTYFQVFNSGPCLSQVVTIPAPAADASSPYAGDLRACGDTCETLHPPGGACADDSAAAVHDDASSHHNPAAGPGRKKLPESRPQDRGDVLGGPQSTAGGLDNPPARRGRRKAIPPSPPPSGDEVGDGPTPDGGPAPPSPQPRAGRRPGGGGGMSDVALTLPREARPNEKTSSAKRSRTTDPPDDDDDDDDNTSADTCQAHAAAQHASKRMCPIYNPILVTPQTVTRLWEPPAAPRDEPRDNDDNARDISTSDTDDVHDTDDTDDADHGDEEDTDSEVSRNTTLGSLGERSETCSETRDGPDNHKPPSGEEANQHPSEPALAVDRVEAILNSLVTRGVEQCVALLQAWRAAATSSTLHLPPCENRVILYRNTQQAKCHEALARYRTRLAHIQLSRRLKMPGPDSAAVYRSRSDIHSLTCEVLGVDPSSADTKSRAFCLQRADISRCLYTGRILDMVSGDGLDFLPVLPAGKLGLTLSDSQGLARRLVSLASEEAGGDGDNAVRRLAAFGRLFARVVQGEQADPLFGLDVESVARLALAAEAPQPPRPMSGPERLATHAWGLADKLSASISRPGPDGLSLLSLLRVDGCAICTHRSGPGPERECSFRQHCELPHPFVRISYTRTSTAMTPRLQAVRHPDVPVLGHTGSASSPDTNPDDIGITAGDIVSVVPGELVLDSSSAAPEPTATLRWRDIGDEVRVAPGVALRIDKTNPFLRMLLAPPTGSRPSELEAKFLAVGGVNLLVLVAVSHVKNGDMLCLR
ncbi:hypothetical protein CGCSCA1_v015068 [Colletotrichum siamense]|nr:hypothetical protein CGCSCA1_v015068 [Colletotrichum siamense]